jgi:hypothetical protein
MQHSLLTPQRHQNTGLVKRTETLPQFRSTIWVLWRRRQPTSLKRAECGGTALFRGLSVEETAHALPQILDR